MCAAHTYTRLNMLFLYAEDLLALARYQIGDPSLVTCPQLLMQIHTATLQVAIHTLKTYHAWEIWEMHTEF
jgi:hypothetical protein